MKLDPPKAAESRRWLLILAVLVFAEVNSSFEVGMMYGALATLMREFGDPVGVGWLITAFLLVGAVSAGLSSRLGDLYGRRRLLILTLVFAMAGSLIGAFATSLPWLIAGRAVQGMSAALLPLTIGLVREHLPKERVPVGIGWVAAMASFTAGAGILLGGWLVDHAGWRWIFWFSVGQTALSIVAVAWLLPPSVQRAVVGGLDLLGGVLFAPGVALLLWAVTRMKGSGPADPVTLGLIAAGLLAIAVWVRHEWRHPQPMIDVRRFAERQTGLAMGLMALFGLGTAQLMLVILLLAQQPAWTGIGLGLTATLAALIKLPASLAGLFGAPWSGHVAARHGARRAALIGSAVICAGWVAVLLHHDAVWLLVAVAFLITLGGSILYAAIPNLIVEVAPTDRTSEINGMSHVVRTVGTAIGTQFATLLLASSTVADATRGSGTHPSPGAYLLTFAFVIACAGAGVLLAMALPRRHSTGAPLPLQVPGRSGSPGNY
ncbi:Major Facilitator Superfamily protein [Variovorax sp. CF079]|uniref:MFS transporter n=1 Tax=Variovorax sp. CF079 TaxID=1882774 RepID=UPI0008855E80|nr:MFS transporter [Variovorax sp. CF079]SDC48068.1 Major Facilitator Superfamily protein [Variovorax sp. CF079]